MNGAVCSSFLIGVLALSPVALAAPECAARNPESGRLTILISDTHFGVGHEPAGGPWHPFEDFRWAADFSAFLNKIDEHGKGATDLVLNGDTFELWQSVFNDCLDDREEDYGCNETEAMRRLQRALAEHGAELAALGKFAGHGGNRVFIVPGNHDAALLFPKLADKVIEAISAPPGAACVKLDGFWLSRDKLIYAEHGHQIGEDVNSFGSRWPKPFWPGSQSYLVRTWGERGVQKFYNEYEEKYPAVDNLDDEGSGMHYALAAEGKILGLMGIGKFVRFALFDVSWSQFVGALSESEAITWNIKTIRRQGDQFLVESFPDGSALREAAGKALAQGELGLSLQQLTDDDINELCDRRAAMVDFQKRNKLNPTVAACPKGNLGSAAQHLLVPRNHVLSDHLKKIRDDLVNSGKLMPGKPFHIFVYSHTHHAEDVFSPVSGTWKPLVVNTGAWQRLIKLGSLEKLKNAKGWNDKQIMPNLHLEDMPACYSFVVIEPYKDVPAAALAFWAQNTDGSWSVVKDCESTSAPLW